MSVDPNGYKRKKWWEMGGWADEKKIEEMERNMLGSHLLDPTLAKKSRSTHSERYPLKLFQHHPCIAILPYFKNTAMGCIRHQKSSILIHCQTSWSPLCCTILHQTIPLLRQNTGVTRGAHKKLAIYTTIGQTRQLVAAMQV